MSERCPGLAGVRRCRLELAHAGRCLPPLGRGRIARLDDARPVSCRLTGDQYEHLEELVQDGFAVSVSDALRRLVQESRNRYVKAF